MRYKIKNVSGSTININDVSILNNESFILKNRTRLNNKIKDIVDDITSGGIINQNIKNDNLEFYINEELKTKSEFYIFITDLVNKQYRQFINSIRNSYQLSFNNLTQITGQSIGLCKSHFGKQSKMTYKNGIGYAWGDVDPYLIPKDCVIKSLRITTASCAVSKNNIDDTLYIKMRIWRINPENNTQLGEDVNLPISNEGVNEWNNIGTLFEKTSFREDLNITIDGGSLIGIEFVNQRNNSSGINSLNKLFATIEIEE